jgi:agmatine deiminase
MSEYRLPAEWEPHEATFIAWPNLCESWSDSYLLISWLFTEIVRVLTRFEFVHVICHDELVVPELEKLFNAMEINPKTYSLHVISHSYHWLRDSGPTSVYTSEGEAVCICWSRNKPTPNSSPFGISTGLPEALGAISGLRCIPAVDTEDFTPLAMEGGVFDSDGEGTLLVTEQCLLNNVPPDNIDEAKNYYQNLFSYYLGAKKVIWLKQGLQGDSTNGHIDNVARFVAPGKIALAWEDSAQSLNSIGAAANLKILENETDALGRKLDVVPINLPAPIRCYGEDNPASYLNFYIANSAVLVPTFNDPADFEALAIIKSLFPSRQVIGIHSRELIVAGGAIHCLTQPISQKLTLRKIA